MLTPFRRRALRATAVLAATVGVAALAGCSGSQGATTLDTKAKVEIEVWSGQADAAQKVIVGLAKEFEKEHPNVTINLSPGASSTDQLLQKLSAGFAGDQYPDMSYAFGSWAGQLEDSGRTLDISADVKKPEVKWDEFTAAARGTAQPTGKKVIGFPAVVDNIGLLYNKTLFDKAGLAYPTADWTWDDFRTAAKKLTDEANHIYGYGYSVSGSEETTWQYWPHLWQNGGAILNDDATKAEFASPAGDDALSFLRSMAVDDKSVYLDQTDVKFGQLFVNDRIGMITSGPWQLSDLKTGGTKYGVVPLPGTNGDHQTVSGPDIWALFDHHDKNRAYWATQFAQWLTSAEQDERFNVAIGNLPLRSSEASSEAVAKEAAEYPGYEVFVANSANVKQTRPTTKGYAALSVAVGKSISQVLQGEGEPKAALEQAAKTADAALAKDK
ncbi:ABC transporter substrate-binding protein [Leifsonia aquatica]|uniref:ABC transporter, solute-binding protein n=2 Tax=Leifsonia aquatica TaxID=144185 RepID=U2RMC3_LEIAQ|nr:ABC transporter substrate-binding protein [Leifsonia aquatica]ERK69976.1 ABC transporter, solute-binding protein [Leifsonia aquatica ATCC 14665]MBB2968621.1 multiple sugar transport system substrate-binding protein [Leifsonia aquatica]